MWTKTPVVTTFDDPIDWQTALQHCNETVLGGDNGGYDDWRLPTIKQLETLTAFDNTQAPVFDSIFNLGEDFDYYTGFWSSTTNDTTNSSAWSINFAYGWIPPANPGTPEKLGYGYEHDVFCVRKLY
jgi:hypothetical protein